MSWKYTRRIVLPAALLRAFTMMYSFHAAPMDVSHLPMPKPRAVERSSAPPPVARHEPVRHWPGPGEYPDPACRGFTEAEKFEYYSRLVEDNGGRIDFSRPTVLALRGVDPRGVRHNSNASVGHYNDVFVILTHDGSGRPRVLETLGATHSGQKTGPAAGGVAMIQPGTYEAVPNGPHHALPSWHVLSETGADAIPCWRDRNGNGLIDKKERQHPGIASSILFHTGVFADVGMSIGCQVMPPCAYRRFVHAIGAHTGFHYTLVDANEVTPGPPLALNSTRRKLPSRT